MFIGQKAIFRHYCIQNVKDGIQIQIYNVNNESVNHFSQIFLIKVKKNLRKSQAQCREKLRKLGLRQNDGLLIKKRVVSYIREDVVSSGRLQFFIIQFLSGGAILYSF